MSLEMRFLGDVVDQLAPIAGVLIPLGLAALGAGWFWKLVTAAAERRREGYSDAVRVLVEWVEFPYRIRRRTSDEPERLKELADLGHELQERIGYWSTWIASESTCLLKCYISLVGQAKQIAGPPSSRWWARPPIARAAEMALGESDDPPFDDGPFSGRSHKFQTLIRWRFGPRRLLAPVVLPVLTWRYCRSASAGGGGTGVALPRADTQGSPAGDA